MALSWGFSTLGCPDLGFDAVLALAAEYGFSSVELRFLDGEDDIAASLERYLAVPGNAERIGAGEVAVACIDTSFNLTAPDAAALEELKRIALLADRLGAPYLRVFGGPEFGETLGPDQAVRARDNYRSWRRWRAEAGVAAALALETHGATSSSAGTLELFDALGETLPIIWDTHHTAILGGERPAFTWERLGRWIVEAHVKDSIDVPSARHPYTYVLPGRGRMPVKDILALLERENLPGPAVLEWERKWHPYLPPLREAIEAMFDAGWRDRP